MNSEILTGAILDMRSFDRGDIDLGALSQLPVNWSKYPSTSIKDVVKRIQKAHIVITNKVVLNRTAIDNSNNLRLVLIAATGTDNVDLDACKERNITVCNVRGYSAPSVVQHTIGLMLNLLTQQYRYIEEVRIGSWSKTDVFCLLDYPIVESKGKVFGVIGYGTLGKQVASVARALGMRVIVAGRKGVVPAPERVDFEEFLKQSDVVSIHCPLMPDTHHLIGVKELMLMQPEAVLINTARGAIIDSYALASALKSGEIAGAGIDVLESEPPDNSHPLLQKDIPNLIVTPHNAWGSRETRQRLVKLMSEIIVAWQLNSPINVVV
ncbi:MAG: D-2-hydroxyacid dehydrogenase [Gammaproteobacteria bacterium]|nr:D-2-hydroxyacid dehydrogenase [Gammaproteobacteria bacterium]MCY4218160.1 D-2-hydroxyacid dehydrogenase [Gammaproteobacteria bacterium]MCY4275323.1 D-2-hydroxyacid dehydrogenase [Gammaproteobacteria bacterium]